ncbi:hypothetical protein V2J09_008926 [Rumex salicifolius]
METDSSTPDAFTAAAANSNVTDPLTSQRYTNLNDLGHELSSLQELAFRGSWRSILDKVSRARTLSLLRLPHDHLLYLSFNVLSLTKLRRFSEAVDDIDSLEDLDSSVYRYESYPKLYPNRFGSMVPFSLRWVHAQLPSMLGKRNETLDRLYKLLDFVRSQIRVKKGLGNLEVSSNVWTKREEFVMSTIIRHHLNQKEFAVCLDLMRDMLAKDPNNPVLLTKLGYVQMQFGNLGGARDSFGKVEGLMKEEKFGGDGEALTEVEMRNLVGRNQALIYLVEKDYVSAVREYDACIERDGSDVVAVNNKAICLMYLRDLSDSIKVLENSLERNPTVALDETLVVNLCSMYELAFANHSDIKKTLKDTSEFRRVQLKVEGYYWKMDHSYTIHVSYVIGKDGSWLKPSNTNLRTLVTSLAGFKAILCRQGNSRTETRLNFETQKKGNSNSSCLANNIPSVNM